MQNTNLLWRGVRNRVHEDQRALTAGEVLLLLLEGKQLAGHRTAQRAWQYGVRRTTNNRVREVLSFLRHRNEPTKCRGNRSSEGETRRCQSSTTRSDK